MEKYIRVTNGELAGQILEVVTSTDSGVFLECKDYKGSRHTIKTCVTTAASKDEIEEFQYKSNTSVFL